MSRWLSFFVSMVVISVAAGCKDRPAAPAAVQPDSPRAVFEHLRTAHASHSYMNMLPWIQPELRNDVLDLLVAVDELMTANTSAQVAISQSCPDLDPQLYDLSRVRYFLGVFSKDAEFIGERIEGDTAEVTFQIAKRLPLKTARFRKHEERWCLVPTESKSGLATSIRLLAKGLNRFAAVVASEACSPEKVESEFHYRVGRKLQVLLPSAGAPASSPSISR